MPPRPGLAAEELTLARAYELAVTNFERVQIADVDVARAELAPYRVLTTVGRAGAASAIITRVIAACESRGIAVEDDVESIVGGLVESIYPSADLFDRLVNGPDEAIGTLPTSTGDVAGVFTIWYQGGLSTSAERLTLRTPRRPTTPRRTA